MADYVYHNGEHWTVQSAIERRVDGQWQEVDWEPPVHSS